MRRELLPTTGKYYKANLHCHTTWSDGRLTPAQCKALYQNNGYSILAYTDHRSYAYHEELQGEDFVALAACEAELNQLQRGKDFSGVSTYHLNLYDTCPQNHVKEKKELTMPGTDYSDINALNEYILNMRKLGFLVCYNHPYWSLQTYEDYKKLDGLTAMEIYNHSCEIDGLYGYHPQAYDEMLRLGKPLFCMAVDDNHNVYPQGHPLCDACGGYTMIHAEVLDYSHVAESLEQGDFYSSTGPELHGITIEDGILSVWCSPVEKIYVIQQGRRCYREVAERGKVLTAASFKLTGEEGYIRIDCKDAKGNHAWSNAYDPAQP